MKQSQNWRESYFWIRSNSGVYTEFQGMIQFHKEESQRGKEKEWEREITKQIIDNSKARRPHSLSSVILTIINYKTVVAASG